MSTGELGFRDRIDAGQRLADTLQKHDIDGDIVLAIPRGGLPVGREVADALELPLDIVVTSKIGAPYNPEFAIGAVASDGSMWLNDDLIDRLGVTDEYIERERERELETARRKAERYREGGEAPDVTNKTVLIVDDGVATGSTAIAAVRVIREKGAGKIVVAVPVGPYETITELEEEADEVICVSTPASFYAVGQFYDHFEQVSDEKAMEYLREGV